MFIQDDFCREQSILQRLQDEALWRNAVGVFNWWEGAQSVAPRNIWEEVIQGVWGANPIVKEITGFEYWINVLDAGGDINHLGWHVDKDENYLKRTGETRCPMVGSVFYGYPHQVAGGFLELSTEPTFTDLERIAPRYNRVVIFDASKQHRVSRLYSGSRFSLQINLWKTKPEI